MSLYLNLSFISTHTKKQYDLARNPFSPSGLIKWLFQFVMQVTNHQAILLQANNNNYNTLLITHAVHRCDHITLANVWISSSKYIWSHITPKANNIKTCLTCVLLPERWPILFNKTHTFCITRPLHRMGENRKFFARSFYVPSSSRSMLNIVNSKQNKPQQMCMCVMWITYSMRKHHPARSKHYARKYIKSDVCSIYIYMYIHCIRRWSINYMCVWVYIYMLFR